MDKVNSESFTTMTELRDTCWNKEDNTLKYSKESAFLHSQKGCQKAVREDSVSKLKEEIR